MTHQTCLSDLIVNVLSFSWRMTYCREQFPAATIRIRCLHIITMHNSVLRWSSPFTTLCKSDHHHSLLFVTRIITMHNSLWLWSSPFTTLCHSDHHHAQLFVTQIITMHYSLSLWSSPCITLCYSDHHNALLFKILFRTEKRLHIICMYSYST